MRSSGCARPILEVIIHIPTYSTHSQPKLLFACTAFYQRFAVPQSDRSLSNQRGFILLHCVVHLFDVLLCDCVTAEYSNLNVHDAFICLDVVIYGKQVFFCSCISPGVFIIVTLLGYSMFRMGRVFLGSLFMWTAVPLIVPLRTSTG